MTDTQRPEGLEDAVEAVKVILGETNPEERRKRLVVDIPKSLHDRLRFAAIMKDTTIKELVMGVVEPLINEILNGDKTND